MKQPNQIFVRRAGPCDPIELVISQNTYPASQTYVLTLGQAKNMVTDLTRMLNGSTIFPSTSGKSGRKSAGG